MSLFSLFPNLNSLKGKPISRAAIEFIQLSHPNSTIIPTSHTLYIARMYVQSKVEKTTQKSGPVLSNPIRFLWSKVKSNIHWTSGFFLTLGRSGRSVFAHFVFCPSMNNLYSTSKQAKVHFTPLLQLFLRKPVNQKMREKGGTHSRIITGGGKVR